MSEAVKSKKELRADIKVLRSEKSEFTTNIRKFKKANGTDVVKKLKDDKLKDELQKLLDGQEVVEGKITALKELMENAASSREKYTYPKVKDQESGEMREQTKAEKKRWRSHARGLAEKEEGLTPEAVPHDAAFYEPKAKKETKKEKKAREEEEAKTAKEKENPDGKEKETPAEKADGDTPTSKKRKKRGGDKGDD